MHDTNTKFMLGIDLGTSAVKVAAVGPDEEVLGEGIAEFGTDTTLPHQAEQAPDDWLKATHGAMQMLADAMSRQDANWTQRVGAIGLTGQLPTLVCLGDQGPIAPAITWKDGRADAWAATRITRGEHYARTGMPIDGRYLAPMFQFHFSDRAEQVRTILSAKDYLLYALTNLRLTEPSTAAGYGVYDLHSQAFAADLCDFWNLPTTLLPRVLPANSLAGPLSDAGAALLGLPAGIPVSTGAADSVSSSYSMAGLDEEVVSISFGSSAVILAASSTMRLDPSARYLLTPHAEEGWYGREMDILASGTGYHWLSSLFGWAEGQIDRRAAESAPGAHGLAFPPYLAGGEQGALWNPKLRGAIMGLSLNHTRGDIARAYLEGVFFEVKRCVDVLTETLPIEAVRVGGRIVHEPSSMQMLADILGHTVAEVTDQSPAAIGAALLARRLMQSEESELVGSRLLRTARPDARTAQIYRSLYQDYLVRAARCE